jgi:hypothetical protein
MTISVRDRKMLWGRSGMRCAICQILLSPLDELGGSTILGEEAHIVSRSPGGPRGDGPLTTPQRDTYSNLILLCPTDHAKIDSLPHGPKDYPVERLLKIKRQHEAAILSQQTFNRKAQLAEEQWASLIDGLNELMGWNNWKDETDGIFSADGPTIRTDIRRRLVEASEWIFRRVWPTGHPRLRSAIAALGHVLNDFLATFGEHSFRDKHSERVEVKRFYQIDEWNPERYHRLRNRYEEHVALIEDLGLELTRYGNHIAQLVREELDPAFRFDDGLLLIARGPNMDFRYDILRPQFTDEDFGDGEPYRGLEQFRRDCVNRDISITAGLRRRPDH